MWEFGGSFYCCLFCSFGSVDDGNDDDDDDNNTLSHKNRDLNTARVFFLYSNL